MIQEQQHQKQRTWKFFLFLGISLFLLISGAVVWILNIAGFLTGPWSNILPVIFTTFGVIIPLLQWLLPSQGKTRGGTPPFFLIQRYLPEEQTLFGAGKRKGALIIIVGKEFRGAPVHLYRGFDRDDLHPDRATNIVLRKIDNIHAGVGFFTALEAGNYTVFMCGEEQKTNVTIQAGQIAEVDWRSLTRKKHNVPKRRF